MGIDKVCSNFLFSKTENRVNLQQFIHSAKCVFKVSPLLIAFQVIYIFAILIFFCIEK